MTGRYGPPAPKPDNLDAMTAAFASGDPVAIAREKAAYNEQLRAAGYPPLYSTVYDEVPDITEQQRGRDE